MLTDPQTLLAKTERRFEDAFIPGLDMTVRFRSLTAGELFQVQAASTPREARLLPLVFTICDEHGRLVFTSDNIDELAEVDSKVIDAMLDVINKHCANQEPIEMLVRRAEKNSESDQS